MEITVVIVVAAVAAAVTAADDDVSHLGWTSSEYMISKLFFLFPTLALTALRVFVSYMDTLTY